MVLYGLEVKTIAPRPSVASAKIPLHCAVFHSTALSTHAAISVYYSMMAPPQPESTLVYDHSMEKAQYASGCNLHPELQSYSYDVTLEAG